MAVSQKNHFKLRGYLNFLLVNRVNLILNLEKLRKYFAKLRNYMLRNNKKPIEILNHMSIAHCAFGID